MTVHPMVNIMWIIFAAGDRNFKRGEGVALLQGSELRFIKIPMVRNMEKMQQICIDALTRE